MSSWIRATEASDNLLPQPRVEEFSCAARVLRVGSRLVLRGQGVIRTPSGRIPGHLATQGAGGPSQDPGHRAKRLAVS